MSPVAVVPDEPELGEQKRCPGCGEWWPLDYEFWYPSGGGKVFMSRCRACTREDQNRRAGHTGTERSRLRLVVEVQGSDRRAWRRAWDKARYAAMTPEEKARRVERRRAWRHRRTAA